MITLFTYAGAFNEPSGSPFCTKTACLLEMSGKEWQRKDVANPSKMPHRKMPVIEMAGQRIPDSHLIQAALEKDGADFYPGLGAKERAMGQAVMRMVEDTLYHAVVYDRWVRDDVWAIMRETFFGTLPAVMRKPISGMVRKGVIKALNAHGISRCTEAERMALVELDLTAVAALLGEQPFLFGDAPTAADAACVALLSAITYLPVETPLRARVRGDVQFAAYVERGRAAFYPAM